MTAVLHVSQPSDGGTARVVADLVSDQVAQGMHVHVACPPGGPLAPWVAQAGGEHHPWQAARKPGPKVILETAALRHICRKLAPDIVHLHSSKAGLVGRLVLRGRLPTIFQPHCWSFIVARGATARAALWWERWAARWTDRVICVSDTERRTAEIAGIQARTRLIPHGVDLSRFTYASQADRDAVRCRLGMGSGPVAMYVGRLAPEKGVDVLLDAWPTVRRRVASAQLIIAGDGPCALSLQERASEATCFVGRRDEVAEWIAAADLVVLPSRYEAGPIVVLEAMARGRSVVATDVGAVRDMLGCEAGAIVPPGDPKRLAAAIGDRLLHPDRCRREGAAGRRRVRAYDVQQTCADVRQLYAEVLVGQGHHS